MKRGAFQVTMDAFTLGLAIASGILAFALDMYWMIVVAVTFTLCWVIMDWVICQEQRRRMYKRRRARNLSAQVAQQIDLAYGMRIEEIVLLNNGPGDGASTTLRGVLPRLYAEGSETTPYHGIDFPSLRN